MQSENKRKTVCVDFDGVIHSFITDWKDQRTIPDDPVPGALVWLHQLLQEYDVIIASSRARWAGGPQAIREWLRHNALADGVPWYTVANGIHALEEVEIQPKPHAHVYIDDRAITFNGTFPDMKNIREFKPWNR